MLRLVSAADDGDPVRTRLPRDRVAADVAHSGLVEQLVTARLVAVDGDTLQIAHEALVRVWPRLRGWLDDDVEGQRLLRHLAGAADAWDAMSRPDSELYRGMRLSRTLEWRDRVDAGPERHRDRVPRRLRRPRCRQNSAPPRRRPPGNAGPGDGCAVRWPGWASSWCSPWSRASSPYAPRTRRRRTGGAARRRPGWLRPGGPRHRQRDRRTRPPDCSSRSRHSPSMTPRRPGISCPRC